MNMLTRQQICMQGKLPAVELYLIASSMACAHWKTSSCLWEKNSNDVSALDTCIQHKHQKRKQEQQSSTQHSWTLALPLSIVQTMHVCTCNTWPVDEPCICAYLKQYSYTWHFGVSQHYTHSWVQQGQHTATLISSVYTKKIIHAFCHYCVKSYTSS